MRQFKAFVEMSKDLLFSMALISVLIKSPLETETHNFRNLAVRMTCFSTDKQDYAFISAASFSRFSKLLILPILRPFPTVE